MKLYPFGRYLLSIPDDHKIAEIHRTHVLYDRLFFQVVPLLVEGAQGAIVDVGANVGDTAALFRTVCPNPILCVEGAPAFLPFLAYNLPRIDGPIKVIERFVRPRTLEALPLDFEPGPGTGHLRAAANSDGIDSDRFVSVEDVLAGACDLAHGTMPALVKLDTDGLDALLLNDLIGRVDCPIFFECDTVTSFDNGPAPWQALFERFDDDAYSAIVFDNVGLPVCCLERAVGTMLTDLSGYVHLQFGVTPVRTHYFDVLLFPAAQAQRYRRVAKMLRSDLLKPYRFRARP
jgi:FkbM family methyltransferase